MLTFAFTVSVHLGGYNLEFHFCGGIKRLIFLMMEEIGFFHKTK
jgi:hypothetical protein